MQRLTRAERQKRIEAARNVALRLVRPGYCIDVDGELQRLAEFRHNRVSIVYVRPRSPASLNPHRLTIRENGKIVFLLEWHDEEQLRSSYKQGEWGRVMRRCLKKRPDAFENYQ
jgi:hypothetical protein